MDNNVNNGDCNGNNLPAYLYRYEEWERMKLLYDSAIKEICTKIEILDNEFRLSKQNNPIEHISSRLKSRESIARKLRRKEHELNVANVMKYVNDVAGIRIICSFTSDIYRIADAIARQNDIKIITIKDYIKNPKANGYMSYHMIVSIPIFLSDRVVDIKVEIQIRTIAMDFWASLEHKIYYRFDGNAPQSIRAELKECADIVAFLDEKMLSINDYVKHYSESAIVDEVLIDDDNIEVIHPEVEEAAESEVEYNADDGDSQSADKNNKHNKKKYKKWKIS